MASVPLNHREKVSNLISNFMEIPWIVSVTTFSMKIFGAIRVSWTRK